MQIQHTKVYRANARRIKSIDRRKLARELAKARKALRKDRENFYGEESDLWRVMPWARTPQGHRYWYGLASEGVHG